MKKTITFIVIMVIMVISCSKSGKNETFQKSTAYIKEINVWAIADEKDFGKKILDINDKVLLNFGDRITINNIKKINNTEYYRISFNNKNNQYWLQKDSIMEKFIVINKKNTTAYSTPDENSSIKTLMQPGDFAIVLKKEGIWLNVDFWAFRAKTGSDKKDFVGNMWIKNQVGYTENIDEAKEAFFLYYAYYYYNNVNDKSMVNNLINRALEISKAKKRNTEITPVIIEFQKLINK
jgi:hypothetical protein